MSTLALKLRLKEPERSSYELQRIATNLRADGHTEIANEYDRAGRDARALESQADEARDHLRALRAATDQWRGQSFDAGLGVAQWLVEQGWTPPDSIPALQVVAEGETTP